MSAQAANLAAELLSHDPCTGQVVFRGTVATGADVSNAVVAARAAQPLWAEAALARRIEIAKEFAARAAASAQLLDAICRETGKPRSEARTEIDSIVGKVAISIDMQQRRTADSSQPLGSLPSGSPVVGRVHYKPLGVVAVIGPFNFPGHLPNGHIVPALLAGNTVVFKPSEHTPLVGQVMHQLWLGAGLPAPVLCLLQGGREVAEQLLRHDLDAVLFTGSETAGRAIHQALATRPHVLCALEMGGNNPLVFHDAKDFDAAAELIVASAFLTAGQRCSCARRLIIVHSPATAPLLEKLIARTKAVRVGAPGDEPEPHIGPVISETAADALLAAQKRLVAAGGRSLVPMQPVRSRRNFLCPGLVDVTTVTARPDEELFGPLLQIVTVGTFAEAITEANRTRFGLSAGLISDERSLRDAFLQHVRAGVIHFNRTLTGASSKLPFGGVAASGNHRPGAAFAADYCADAIAVVDA